MRVAQGPKGSATPEPLLWATAAALGAAATLMTSFGLVGAVLFLLLAIPLVIRGGLAALSGLLTGFGALWSVLMARQSASGGRTENADFWIAFGVVPLVVGGALLLLIAGRVVRSRWISPR